MLFRSVYDAQNTVLWVFFPSVTGNVSGSIDTALVYHLGRKKWGRCTQTVECVLNYISAGITIDQMDTPFATIENASTVSFDSQFWLSGGRMLTVFNSSHQLCSMTGSSTSSSMTLFDLGDDQAVTTLKRVRVGYQTEPTTGMVRGTTRMSRGGAQTDGPPGTFSNGKYDIRQTGRFHRVSIAQTGDWVADQVDFDLVAAGQR